MPHSSPVARVPDGSSALLRDRRARQVYRWPARTGTVVEWPAWVPQPVREAWARVGVSAPWQHQVEVANAAVSGQDVVVSTRTASGKSLAYLLPVLAATYGGRDARGPERSAVGAGPTALIGPVDAGPPTHTALYLAPTKALAADQLRACHALGLPGWQVATLDGDTEPDARDWVRQFAGYVLTNPDMLHRSVLPHHARWARLLRSLRYVVIDEAHRYRGVFGAQVAAVLGRLRRLPTTTAATRSSCSRPPQPPHPNRWRRGCSIWTSLGSWSSTATRRR